MKQYEAALLALERLGGQATLAQLYWETMKVPGVKWGTKTPFASIRRIVQERPEIFRVRPGLWALESHRSRLGLERAEGKRAAADESAHAYYQGLLAMIGNLRGLRTYIPNHDRNRICLQKRLGEVRSLEKVPPFSYDPFVRQVATIDVSWFNDRRMPDSLFEVEQTTNIQDSLVKFLELQDFHARMVIVASAARRREFEDKKTRRAFRPIAQRVSFYACEALARDYEYEAVRRGADFVL